MAKYIVMKGSRAPGGSTVRVGDAYAGPATDCAGVRPGHVYASKAGAMRAARKLTRCNPVGFTVHRVGSR